MIYELLETHEFEREFNRLPNTITSRFKKQLEKVKENPYNLGKPLRGRNWFRELKQKNYRLYYLVFEQKIIVLLVFISTKKDQQEIISTIVKRFDDYKDEIEKIKNNN